jgi:hemolysin activation/secretion protein
MRFREACRMRRQEAKAARTIMGRLTAPGAALALAAAATAAFGQASVPLNQLPRPSDQPLPAPPPQVPRPEIVVPPLPVPPEGPALSRGVTVTAKGFRFEGNTVIPEADLQAIAAPFAGRPLGNAELEELRQRLTRRYIEAGYINSGAVIPDQDVADGIITFRIVEGRLSDIVIGGDHHFDPALLRDRLALGAGPPLNVNELQERMQLMLQDPLIAQLSAQLAPGVAPGEAVLRVDVTEAPRYLAGIVLDNDRSPAVGSAQAQPFFAVRNLAGRGDVLSVRGAFTSGVQEGQAAYSLPLNARGTALNARYVRTNSRIMEAPLDQLDIFAHSEAFDVGVSQPLVQRLDGDLAGTFTYSHRSTKSYFLGQPSTLIPGAPNGVTVISALRFGLEGAMRSQSQVLAGRVLLSQGIDAFGATVAPPGIPDSRFTAILGQLQWVGLVGADGQLVLRADGQRANNPLLGSEKFSLGGLESVRGYPKDALVRDSGWFTSAEFRYRVANLSIPAGPLTGSGPVRVAAFYDYGRAWDYEGPTSGQRSLGSVGPGIRWEPLRGAELVLYYGHRLRELATGNSSSLANKGFNLRFTFAYAF